MPTHPEVRLRVLVASDVRIYGQGLASVLATRPGIEVSGTASSASELLAAAVESDPDVILIDMAMPDSIRAVGDVRDAASTCVVALALPEVESTFLTCAEAGIDAYVPVDASIDELVQAIRSAVRGEPRIAPRLTESLLRRVRFLSERSGAGEPGASLTPREKEVARLVAEGKTNKRIARELDIQLATVKNHVHNILKKMGASHRAEIASRMSPWRTREPSRLRARRRLDDLSRHEAG